MATISKSNSVFKIRSISLPCRSHPSTCNIEVELNKIKSGKGSTSSSPSSKHITDGILSVKDLYNSVEDLLNMQMTKLALLHHQCAKFIDDLQDQFISLLDVLSTTLELMSQVKEHGRYVQSSLRKRNGDLDIENIVSVNTCIRKKTMKSAKKLISKLKEIENRIDTLSLFEVDHQVSSFIRSLNEVVEVSIVTFNSTILFLLAPILKPKTRWLTVSKLLHKGGAVTCENQIENLNELQSLDLALDQLCNSESSKLGDDHKIKVVQNSLKSLEISINEIESGLECLFRGLIRAKASLLNLSSSFV